MRALSPALMADGAEGFGAGGLDFAAARTSVSVTRPSGPVPLTLASSTPSSAATRRATGDAFTRASSGFSTFGAGFSSSAFFSALGGVAFFSSSFSTLGSSFSFFGFSSFSAGSSFASSFFSSLALGFYSSSASFFLSAFSSSSFGVFSSSPPMNAILSPTFTFPPSST